MNADVTLVHDRTTWKPTWRRVKGMSTSRSEGQVCISPQRKVNARRRFSSQVFNSRLDTCLVASKPPEVVSGLCIAKGQMVYSGNCQLMVRMSLVT